MKQRMFFGLVVMMALPAPDAAAGGPNKPGADVALAGDHPPLAKTPFGAEQARQFQQQWANHLGKSVVETNSIGMKMVLIPPGEFLMGATADDLKKTTDEIAADPKQRWRRDWVTMWTRRAMPQHRVRITRPFYMAATEVTVGQFRQFVEETGYKTDAEKGVEYDPDKKTLKVGKPRKWNWRNITPPGQYDYKKDDRFCTQRDDEPACHISWRDATAFCQWLAEKDGRQYRLPTEAEWEWACRAGSQTRWHFGDDPGPLPQYAWYAANSQGRYHPGGTKRPNAFGLYDMIGNVYEWCSDLFGASYYRRSPVEDPPGPAKYEEPGGDPVLRSHVLRGASADAPRWYLRSVYRVRAAEHSNHHSHLGFRVAMSLETSPATQSSPANPSPGAAVAERRPTPASKTSKLIGLATNFVKYDKNPVLDIGKPGQWDDSTIGCTCVKRIGDTFFMVSRGRQETPQGDARRGGHVPGRHSLDQVRIKPRAERRGHAVCRETGR